jgi:hypothetical protein
MALRINNRSQTSQATRRRPLQGLHLGERDALHAASPSLGDSHVKPRTRARDMSRSKEAYGPGAVRAAAASESGGRCVSTLWLSLSRSLCLCLCLSLSLSQSLSLSHTHAHSAAHWDSPEPWSARGPRDGAEGNKTPLAGAATGPLRRIPLDAETARRRRGRRGGQGGWWVSSVRGRRKDSARGPLSSRPP